ncbi:MAG: hypothetical protein ACTTKJ_05245 [Prevotella koreensis]|uniref:hypothetical protein n=1 Tax=Prevotella koreensis TaxID=2490854 RepID=UPI003F9FA644
MRDDIRRVAAHEVDVCGEELLHNAVVELSHERVVNYYSFADELPFTEWLGGRIEIRRDGEGTMKAYRSGRLLT